ncbi:hypothetical protein B0H10DRAFT_707827 [Mycena sp. CBHHK59/15]|nr:hypothetical protein B0H10DRAFT_707827 [Mycena sp. CBHHK59/15]
MHRGLRTRSSRWFSLPSPLGHAKSRPYSYTFPQLHQPQSNRLPAPHPQLPGVQSTWPQFPAMYKELFGFQMPELAPDMTITTTSAPWTAEFPPPAAFRGPRLCHSRKCYGSVGTVSHVFSSTVTIILASWPARRRPRYRLQARHADVSPSHEQRVVSPPAIRSRIHWPPIAPTHAQTSVSNR